MSDYPSLSRILLTNPSLLAPVEGAPASSWIQICKTGEFTSNRYGKFGITKDDLKQMLHNFKHVTPKAPTELPVDYDHLSMDPKKPGDGVAAGWFKDLQLREDGDELWGLVSWTPKATDAIKNGEYRFVSPSFVKDHTHKDGSKIGTTLLAAAITNHPFLDSMAALTLYNFSALGDLALDVAPATVAVPVRLDCAEVGQKVTFDENPTKSPELTAEERAATYTVQAIVGDGADAFVQLVTADDGTPYGWYREDQLAPAPAEDKADKSPLPAKTVQEEGPMNNSDVISAAKFAEAVKQFELSGKSAREAMTLAMRADAEGAQAYRRQGIGSAEAPEAAGPVLQLSVLPADGETFESVVGRYVSEHPGVTLKTAIRYGGVKSARLGVVALTRRDGRHGGRKTARGAAACGGGHHRDRHAEHRRLDRLSATARVGHPSAGGAVGAHDAGAHGHGHLPPLSGRVHVRRAAVRVPTIWPRRNTATRADKRAGTNAAADRFRRRTHDAGADDGRSGPAGGGAAVADADSAAGRASPSVRGRPADGAGRADARRARPTLGRAARRCWR